MNERIEQLAREAAHSTRMSYNNAYWWPMMDETPEDKAWREKFAELIVRECIDVVGGFRNSFDDPASDEIRQHFGVDYE